MSLGRPGAPLASFYYDGLGRRDYQTLLNGTAATWTRDPLDRLTQIATIVAPPNNFTLGFTYNPAGGIAANTRSNDAYAWSGHYAVNRAYTTNGLNRYSAISSLTPNPTYDANGNLTSAGATTYTYDVENRLVSASGGVTLVYDPLGRLSQIATAGGATRRFAYDGDALIDEFDGAGNVRRVYVHGPNVDEPMFWWDIPAGTWGTLQADERGSIVAVVNNGGAAATINRYDEYGIPGGGNAGAFQYTGQVWLPELGMYYYKARIYSPTLGRFLQTDPIGYEGGINLYAYVNDDPMNLTDPDGQNPAIDRRVAGLMSLSPDEKLEALGYILGAAAIWLPGPEDLLLGAWLGRTITGAGRSGNAARGATRGARSARAANGRSGAQASRAGGRRGSEFSRATKQERREMHPNCENCGGPAPHGQADRRGVGPNPNRSEIHHRRPASEGGTRDPSNAQNLCRKCHLEAHRRD